MRKFFNKKIVKRVVAIYLVAMMVILNGARYTYAVPTPPGAPEAPTAPTYEGDTPSVPTAPDAPTYESNAPIAPDAPVYGTDQTTEPAVSGEGTSSGEIPQTQEGPNQETTTEEPTSPATSEEPVQTSTAEIPGPLTSSGLVAPVVQSTGDEVQSDLMGNASIVTGNADNTGAIINTGIENVLTSSDTGVDGGIVVKSSGNGTGSTNTGSATINNDSNHSQTNTTTVVNNMDNVSDSGNNLVEKNMGDAQITTGDANVTGTIINAVNTNIDGIMVSEFNVVDDQVGDIILNFADSCISNCGTGEIAVLNTGNGSDSTNTGNLEVNNNDTTFQQNDANVENNMVLTAITGKNEADKNMGEASITTGDANIEANIVNMVNNNIAGDVVYAVVNIFGNLVGDIIIPVGMLEACCTGSDVTVANTNNNSGSTNTANVDINQSDLINQLNNANIDNNLYYDASTGDNGLSKVMGGDTSITSGDAGIVAQVLNVANTNIIGGNAWLVIVNEAGKWIGKIIGGDGSNLAGSEGFEFIVNDAGDILAVNDGNGTDSVNTTNVTVNDNDTFTQVNNANVVNNVVLTANTGDNSAEKNMGGSSIVTGDAKIVANIVNFVNNNIIGTGKLFVTVVNVFGSWLGDIVPPGFEQEPDPEPAIGGGDPGILDPTTDPVTNPVGNGGGGSGGGSGNNSGGSGSSGGSVATTLVSAIFTKPKAFGTGIGGGSLLADAASDETTGGVVEGAQTANKVRINLAYALLGLPLIPGAFILKKKLLLLKAVSGK
ncbi:MAG TPA: hypothetical protein VI819_02095 [Patescibacteria group bacterium]|nr:hypothetical protein [Patescibacteria group bacterium]